MAINSTSGGAATVEITSWAYNEASAGSQAQANGTDEVVFANDINGTNNGNVAASPTFTGRCVVKNRGLGDEEVRYITAQTAGTGTTIIATVSEPWVDAPASTDTLEVCYIVQDAATVNGVALVNKTNDDYDFSKAFEVQSGGGYFLLNGATQITDTNGSTTSAEIRCLSGGWFQIGVKQFGRGVRGGRVTLSAGTGPADGDWGIDIQSGAVGNFYSADIKGGVSYNSQFSGTIEILDSKLFKCIYNCDSTGIVTMENVVAEGTGLTTDRITCDATTDVQSLVYGNADGFRDDASATVETITLKDVDWSGLSKHIEVRNANKTFVVLDAFNFEPVITDQTELDFTAAGAIDQKNSLQASITTPGGTAINGAKVYVQEHDQTDLIEHELTADSNGDASADILYRTYRDNAGTSVTRTVYGTWAVKVYEYGKLSVDRVVDFSNRAVELGIAMVNDPDVTAVNAATALTNGAGITIERHGTGETDTRPMKVMRIDGVVTAPAIGDVIDDNATGTKSGTVIDFINRGSGVFDVVLENWSGTDFADNDVLDLNAAAWDAGAVAADTAGFYKEVSYWLGEENVLNTAGAIYDFMIAKLEQATLDTANGWDEVLIAGDQEWAVPYQGNGAGVFFSLRNAVTHQEGWWIGRVSDLGNIDYLTMDDGTQWLPPATVSVTVTGMPTTAEITFVRQSDGVAVFNVETVGGTGSATYTYTYTGDVDVDILIHDVTNNVENLENVTLTNSDQTLPATFSNDRVYSNP